MFLGIRNNPRVPGTARPAEAELLQGGAFQNLIGGTDTLVDNSIKRDPCETGFDVNLDCILSITLDKPYIGIDGHLVDNFVRDILCYREWTNNPGEMTGMRYKNVNLMDRKQKRMGLVSCFGGSYKGTWQLFGHVHSGPNSQGNGKDDSRLTHLFPTQYDVGVDNNDFRPVSYAKVGEKIRAQIEKANIKG